MVSSWWTACRRGPEQDFPDEEAPRLVVTLVHGTWGISSKWTRPDESFEIALRGELKKCGVTAVQFRRFPWSGGNTFAARKTAQAVLVEHIRKVAEKRHAHYIVSHSHGGNVALRH